VGKKLTTGRKGETKVGVPVAFWVTGDLFRGVARQSSICVFTLNLVLE